MARDQSITGGDTNRGDAALVGLGVLAGGWALGSLAGGDEARSLEVAAESIAATGALTTVVKGTVRRKRPSGGNYSFPSGHTSGAFAAATFLARSMADAGDEWYWDLGYLAYVPAAYVGINRIEGNRHFPSDVTFGAFLGVFTTNLIYNAHYGDATDAGIYDQPKRLAWHIEPILGPDEASLAFEFDF